jgi:ATP adenylyltransferase
VKRLWSPWRLSYVGGTYKKSAGCLFCEKAAQVEKDSENYVLLRGERGFMLLNLFPYNTGHLMVAPYAHVAGTGDLDASTLGDLMVIVNRGIDALKQVLKPDGYNVGINLGAAAGAGITDHVHIHVVPRWVGDTNFMPVFAEAKVIPELLDGTYSRLKAVL